MAEFQSADEGRDTNIFEHPTEETFVAIARRKVEVRRMLEDVLEENRQRRAEWSGMSES
ncbi:hypothetical protein [Collimonas humicola]|uniref:hypothetical protein n=1 Tax=Collimonas humicola TaxID=2825886 RepID=UPI001B8CB322|nr:hypothetical protein [Collimonas humicola]